MSLKNIKNETYFELNNKINIPQDGKIPLGYDKKAIKAFMEENVEPNYVRFSSIQDRFHYLIQHHYYDGKIVHKYSIDFIERLYKFLKSKQFRFASFMAAYKFYRQYALKTNDNKYYLENYLDRIVMNALMFANGDEKLALKIADEIISHRYQPATPSFLNAGRARRGEFVSCFLIQPTDNMNTIGRTINSALQLSKIGGGVGINLSNLRCAGDPIKGIMGASSGVIPVMKLLEDSFTYSNQLGQRQGAGAVYLNVFHPDIISFLSTKKENADEKIRVKTLSLGLTVPNKFYQLCRDNDTMCTFSPYDVERYYHKPFSYVDISRYYDEMVRNPKIRKPLKFPARKLETEISELQQESGYPYIFNVDTANRDNPIHGKIVMSNLCSEIMQVMKPSVVDDNQDYQVLGTDISCNLGSINIENMMKAKNFGDSIDTMVRALSYVSDATNITVVPPVRKGNEELHSVGLGSMNLAGYLAVHHIQYGSPVALEFTKVYFMMLRYYALRASCQIAKEKHTTFKGFRQSKYADGSAIRDYVTHDWRPKMARTKELFKGHYVPDQEDWTKLQQAIEKYGIYNAYLLAIAPNGSTGYLNSAISSLYPCVDRIEDRYEGKTGNIYYPAPYLSNDTLPYYKSAYDIDQRKVIDTFAEAERSVDQGAALVLFMRSTIPKGMYEWKKGDTQKMTTRDLNILRNYAFYKGIKSIYYVRTFTDDKREIGANECSSCEI